MEQESLNKTWFVDVDGTIVEHMSDASIFDLVEKYGDESYLHEKPIKRSVDFLNSLPEKDTIVITTAREEEIKDHTLKMLDYFGIRYDKIIFSLRSGPRYLVNDIKPVGVAGNDEPLDMAFAINVERNAGICPDSSIG